MPITDLITKGDWKAVDAQDGGFAILSSARYGHSDPEVVATIGADHMAPQDQVELAADAVLMARAADFHTALTAIATVDEGDPASVHQAILMARLALKAAEDTFTELTK